MGNRRDGLESSFKVGDVVYHKAGGPRMAIHSKHTGLKGHWWCQYFNRDLEVVSKEFNEAVLEKMHNESLPSPSSVQYSYRNSATSNNGG